MFTLGSAHMVTLRASLLEGLRAYRIKLMSATCKGSALHAILLLQTPIILNINEDEDKQIRGFSTFLATNWRDTVTRKHLWEKEVIEVIDIVRIYFT